MQNGKRKRKELPKREEADCRRTSMPAAGHDEAILEHVRMVTSLIEGRKVSRQEVLEMLEREEKRQQGIHKKEEPGYPARERTENSS